MKELPIGQNLQEVQSMAYLFNGRLVCEHIVFYLKFEDWYKVVVSEGKSEIKQESPVSTPLVSTHAEFSYPVQVHTQVRPEAYKKLKEIHEYLWNGKPDESCGLCFIFENDAKLYLLDLKDCMVLHPGDYTFMEPVIRKILSAF